MHDLYGSSIGHVTMCGKVNMEQVVNFTCTTAFSLSFFFLIMKINLTKSNRNKKDRKKLTTASLPSSSQQEEKK